jgi:hypothetical protein
MSLQQSDHSGDWKVVTGNAAARLNAALRSEMPNGHLHYGRSTQAGLQTVSEGDLNSRIVDFPTKII